MITYCRTGREQRFMDRMLLASVLECRGAERFRLVYEALPAGDVKKFYHHLWASEAKHGEIFVEMLFHYFDKEEVYQRLDFLMERESEVIAKTPIRAALH